MDASKARPAAGGPSEKERRYDRQLRLWASSGQDALESAHILLINTGPGIIGIETLKNLVLPGSSHPGPITSSVADYFPRHWPIYHC